MKIFISIITGAIKPKILNVRLAGSYQDVDSHNMDDIIKKILISVWIKTGKSNNNKVCFITCLIIKKTKVTCESIMLL